MHIPLQTILLSHSPFVFTRVIIPMAKTDSKYNGVRIFTGHIMLLLLSHQDIS